MKLLVRVNQLKKTQGGRELFNGAGLSLGEKQKIGMIGRNGAGKSTLFRILIGEDEPDSGEIIKSEDLRLGYLPQKDPFEPQEIVHEFLMRFTGKQDWECGKIAGRFQIKNDLLKARIEELSGGYRMRVKLAAMLLLEPNFLLLDEPTNYLDLDTLLLLENFLQGYNGGCLLISHDREFLKKTCEWTLEADSGELVAYPGDIEEYMEFKEARLQEQLAFNKNIEARRKELSRFIERFHAKASKASQARSKQKQLDRLQGIEIRSSAQGARIRIPQPEARKGPSLRADSLAIGYGNREVVSDIRLDLKRGARAAVLGDNGQGKSTLLKTIAGELPALGGELRLYDREIGYYAQHVYSALGETGDVLTYLENTAQGEIPRQELLDLAASFLFSGENLQKPLSVLSGGERARLCLASLLLKKYSLLLFDEPTNHLDFETVEALGEALRSYQGTVIFVSHDRTFVNLVAQEIIEIREGKAVLFPGSYEDYVHTLESRLRNDVGEGREKETSRDSGAKTNAQSEAKPKNAYQLRKERNARLNKLKKEIALLEKEQGEVSKEKDDLHERFIQNPAEYSRENADRLAELEERESECEERWLALQEEIEELEAQDAG